MLIVFFQFIWILFILFVWFETDAFLEYSRLLKLSRLFKIDRFDEQRILNPKAYYLTFLRKNYNNFFIRLITCLSCLTFWLSLLCCIIFQNLICLPIVYLLSYSTFVFFKRKSIF